MSLHICRAPAFTYRTYRYCRWCDARKGHVLIDHTWWGWELVCCGCGVRLNSERGELRRPAVNPDRRPLIQLWNEALTRSDYRRAVADYLGWAK